MWSIWPTAALLLTLAFAWTQCRLLAGRSTLGAGSYLLFFAVGAIGASLAAVTLQRLSLVLWSPATASWAIGPIIEEAVKVLPALLVLRVASERLLIADITLIGLASGLGFGFVEANFRVLAGGQGTPPASYYFAAADAISSGGYAIHFPSHGLTAAFVALVAAIGCRLFRGSAFRIGVVLAAFAIVTFDHSVYNWKLQSAITLFGQIEHFTQAPALVEWLYSLTGHGRLEAWALPGLLVLASWLEARWLRMRVGDRPGLMLAAEWTRPLVPIEWLRALREIPRGQRPVARVLTYWRHRRSAALAGAALADAPADRPRIDAAAALDARAKRERRGLDQLPPSGWMPSSAAVRDTIVRLAGPLAFSAAMIVLFAFAPRALSSWLSGRVISAVFAAVGLVIATKRWLSARGRATPGATGDGEAWARYEAQRLLTYGALVSGVVAVAAWFLPTETLLGTGAYMSAAMGTWVHSSGNLAVLTGAAAASPVVVPPPHQPCHSLRKEVQDGDAWIAQREKQAGQPGGDAPLVNPTPLSQRGVPIDDEATARVAATVHEAMLGPAAGGGTASGTPATDAGGDASPAPGSGIDISHLGPFSGWTPAAPASRYDPARSGAAPVGPVPDTVLGNSVGRYDPNRGAWGGGLGVPMNQPAVAPLPGAPTIPLTAPPPMDKERTAQRERQRALADCEQSRTGAEPAADVDQEEEEQETTAEKDDPKVADNLQRDIDRAKEEFEKLQEELRDEVNDRLAAIGDVTKKYDELFAAANEDLDEYARLTQAIGPDLEKLWQAHNEMAWALKQADAADFALMLAQMLIPAVGEMGAEAAVTRAEVRAERDAAARLIEKDLAAGKKLQDAGRAFQAEKNAARAVQPRLGRLEASKDALSKGLLAEDDLAAARAAERASSTRHARELEASRAAGTKLPPEHQIYRADEAQAINHVYETTNKLMVPDSLGRTYLLDPVTDADLMVFTSKRLPESGVHEVIVHGAQGSFELPAGMYGGTMMPARNVGAAELMPVLEEGNYIKGTPLKLYSCNTGNPIGPVGPIQPVAVDAAHLTGNVVYAPDGIVGVKSDGSTMVYHWIQEPQLFDGKELIINGELQLEAPVMRVTNRWHPFGGPPR